MATNATIVFTDIAFKEVGRVTVEDGKFSGDTMFANRMAEDAKLKGLSGEDFIEKFSEWTNGHYWSEKA